MTSSMFPLYLVEQIVSFCAILVVMSWWFAPPPVPAAARSISWLLFVWRTTLFTAGSAAFGVRGRSSRSPPFHFFDGLSRRTSRSSWLRIDPTSSRRSILEQDCHSTMDTRRQLRSRHFPIKGSSLSSGLDPKDSCDSSSPLSAASSAPSSPIPALGSTPGPKRRRNPNEIRPTPERPSSSTPVTPDASVSAEAESSNESSSAKKPKRAPGSSPTKTPASPAKVEKRQPPKGWESIYGLVQELRMDRTAPCDHSGCESLARENQSDDPRDLRFASLVSLVLSSQTKDAVVGEAVRAMKNDGALSVEKMLEMPAEKLNSYLKQVGFHNNKTKYLKQIVQILQEQYGGDIPPTAEEMMKLPGVGPKMAYICENVAWNRVSGIGVDTHMHRLFNALGWVKSSTPEQTRLQLESWLPTEYWMDVNLLWVGFGQEVQQFKPKILRKALDCRRPADALRLLKRCGLDYAKEGAKIGLEDEIRAALKGASSESKQQ